MNRAVIGSPPVRLFSFGSSQCLPGAKLLRRHQPRAAQHGHVARMPVGLRDEQQILRRHGGVVAEHSARGVEQHALAVAALAPGEEQDVLLDLARERVAERALHERDQLGVVAEDAREERRPERRGACPAALVRRRSAW